MRKINREPLSMEVQLQLTNGPEYNIPGVKEVLSRMQNFHENILCCYCENKLAQCSFSDIEHVKPKSRYPESKLDWENLLLACNKCNRSYKKDNYEEGFLNPSDSNYVFENNFDFNEECFYISKNTKARLTCDIVKLNEKDKHSFKSRLELKLLLIKNMEDYKTAGLDKDKIKTFIKRDFYNQGELCSFGEWILENILNSSL